MSDAIEALVHECCLYRTMQRVREDEMLNAEIVKALFAYWNKHDPVSTTLGAAVAQLFPLAHEHWEAAA